MTSHIISLECHRKHSSKNSNSYPSDPKRLFSTDMLGVPGDSLVKNPAANAGDTGDVDLIPGAGRSHGVGAGNPLQCYCWRIPWTEEPGRLECVVRPDCIRLSECTRVQ